MPKKIKHYVLTALITGLCLGDISAQEKSSEILTLFTTQEERSLIDSNRYKNQSSKQTKKPVVVQQEVVAETESEIIYEPQLLKIKVSGVTLAQDGTDLAWVNGKAYENGAKLEDGSKVYISRKIKNAVQIKTPDGKYHNLVTGQSTDIKYMKPVED